MHTMPFYLVQGHHHCPPKKDFQTRVQRDYASVNEGNGYGTRKANLVVAVRICGDYLSQSLFEKIRVIRSFMNLHSTSNIA